MLLPTFHHPLPVSLSLTIPQLIDTLFSRTRSSSPRGLQARCSVFLECHFLRSFEWPFLSLQSGLVLILPPQSDFSNHSQFSSTSKPLLRYLFCSGMKFYPSLKAPVKTCCLQPGQLALFSNERAVPPEPSLLLLLLRFLWVCLLPTSA